MTSTLYFCSSLSIYLNTAHYLAAHTSSCWLPFRVISTKLQVQQFTRLFDTASRCVCVCVMSYCCYRLNFATHIHLYHCYVNDILLLVLQRLSSRSFCLYLICMHPIIRINVIKLGICINQNVRSWKYFILFYPHIVDLILSRKKIFLDF